MPAAARADDTLQGLLVAAIGAVAISADDASRIVMGMDVYRSGGAPALVVSPANVADLQAAVRICADAGVAMVPRSGGASYSDGYLYGPGGHVLFDLGALDDIAIDVENAVVAVGAGVTWAALRTELARHGLRTPFWGPFSGLVATVGGSVSQNALSHGSGAHGISAGSVLSMDIVLASGELLRTGASDATRNYGPDLTGLFCGDCGALGIKATIRLPLIAQRPHFAGLSFAFDDFAAFHEGARLAEREGLDDEHFGLDRALSQGQIARQDGATAKLRIARDVLCTAPTALAGLRQLVRMALAGEGALRAGAYMLHFMVEGVDAVEVSAKARRLRAIVAPFGREIANSVPTFVRAVPFAPLINIVGPGGERWVPLHGVLAHRDVVPFHAALMEFYAVHREEMDRLGIWTGTMFSPVGSTGFLYEVALYWPDARTAYHDMVLDPYHLATLPLHGANPAARAVVDRLKRDIIALYQRFDAAHFQIGRAYPYRARLDVRADALLARIKAELDPHGLMNPGVLDLARSA